MPASLNIAEMGLSQRMFGIFKRNRDSGVRTKHRIPAGLRVYAIGDVHGCRQELDRMLDLIDAECRTTALKTQVIFLGDLVDRGPDSAGVVDRLQRGDLPGDKHSFLTGNHEEAMLRVWEGDGEVVPGWLRYGGVQTLESYGLDRSEIFKLGLYLPRRMREVVPRRHIDFIKSFRDQVRVGDYWFVHAGIRPGFDLEMQDPNDLRWIREEFLGDERDHGAMIVHGHTITNDPDVRSNRIGIDTGCYSSGCLTALVIEGSDRRFLRTAG
jgi:serine/threonine protein phosphatase 1